MYAELVGNRKKYRIKSLYDNILDVELGTGPLFESPPPWLKYTSKRGRGIVPWYWKDDSGEWHVSYGSHPYPFLRPAIEDHIGEYKQIIETELKG